MQEIKIFISSPGDVQAERALVEGIVERLQGDYWNFVRLEAVLWENEATRAVAHFNEELIAPAECDIVLVFLWTRLGSRMPPQFTRADGSRFESGTEWEIVTALEAYEEQGRPDVMVYRRFEQGPLPGEDEPARRAEAIEQRAKLERFWGEWFLHPDGTVRRAFVAFESREDLAPRLTEQLRRLIHKRLPASVPAYEVFRPEPLPMGSPFRGLHAFGFEDAPLFFGRSRAVAAIVRQLRAQAARTEGGPFVLILGGSGSGKSSLARAGAAARLTHPNTTAGVDVWRQADLHPSAAVAEQTPLDVLAATLLGALPELAAQALGEQAFDAAALAEKMADPEWLVLLDTPLRAALADAAVASGAAREAGLFLVVDQLEELFTDKTTGKAEREAFVRALAFLAGTRAVWIVATMRSEFFARAIELPALRLLMRGEGSYTLLPPDAGEISQIVRYPAAAANLRWEKHPSTGESLADAIQAEATRDARALPLLEFLLQDLYEHRDANNVLRWDRYEAVGKLAGALVSHAEAALAQLHAGPEREALDLIFLALVTMDDQEQAVPTRNRAPRAALERIRGGAGARVLEVFIEARLFVTDAEAAVPVVSLAHEALLTHWPYLQEFVRQHATILRARRRLADLCNRWREKADLDPRGAARLLLAEGSLAEAQEVVRFHPPDLTDQEREFVDRSALKAQRRVRQLQAAVAVFAALAVAALLAGGFAWRQQRIAQEQTRRAEEQTGVAQTQEKEANAQRTNAQRREEEAVEANRRSVESIRQFKAQVHEASMSDLATARDLFGAGNWRQGLAYLGRSLKYEPDNRLAGSWFWNELVYGDHQRDGLPQYILSHQGHVLDAAYSPDGARVVTTSLLVAQQWDARTGQPIGEPLRHNHKAGGVAYSPDGARIVTVCAEEDKGAGYAQQWESATGKPIGGPLRHDGVGCVAYSPDGARIITVGEDGTARQWEALTGKPVGKPWPVESPIDKVSYSPDGTRVLIASAGYAQQWNAATGKSVGEQIIHEGDLVRSAAYSPDGARIVTAGQDGTARQWEAASGKPVGEPLRHADKIYDAAYSPDGLRIVTAGKDKTARQWDAMTGGAIGEPLRHEDVVWGAAYSPDGRCILTFCFDNTARQWDATTGKAIGEPQRREGTLAEEGIINTAAYSPDGTRVVTDGQDGTTRQWDALTGRPIGEPLASKFGVGHPAYSPDGKRIVTASSDHIARQWDASTGKLIGEPMRHKDGIASVAYSRDGTRVVTASGNSAWQWDALTGQPIGEPLRHEKAGRAQRVATNESDDDDSLHPVDTVRVLAAAYSPNGARIVTACSDGTARQWEAATGKPIGEPVHHGKAVKCAYYSPDGLRIVTASSDKSARQWDALTGQPIGGPMIHAGEVNGAVYSPDGSRVLTASGEFDENGDGPGSEARQWDAATGQAISEPLIHEGPVFNASYRLDGKRMLTACKDQVVRQWEIDPPAGPPPVWFDRLVQVAAGYRFSENGDLLILPTATRLTLREQLVRELKDARPDQADVHWLALAGWFLSRTTERTVTPGSPLDITALAERELASGREAGIRNAYALAPNLPLVHLALASFEDATFLWEYEMKRLPADAAALRIRAAAMLRAQGQARLALQVLEGIAPATPPTADLLMSLALTRRMNEDRDGAVRECQRLLALDPGFADSARVRALSLPPVDFAALSLALADTLRRHPELVPKPPAGR